MVQKISTALLASGFVKVANNNKFWNQWLVVDIWATLINQELQLPDELKVTGSYLSLLLLRSVKYKPRKDVIYIYHNPNCYYIFRSKFGKVTAFYFTATQLTPKLNNHMPGGSTQFVRELVATIQTHVTTITTNTTTNLPLTTVSGVNAAATTCGSGQCGATRMPSAKESAMVDEPSNSPRAPTTSKVQ
jgi:hypothetical protein